MRMRKQTSLSQRVNELASENVNCLPGLPGFSFRRSFQHSDSFSAHRNSVADGHHIDFNARIKSEHLRYSGNFRCRQTDSHRQQSVLSVGQQSEIQDCSL